MKKQFVITIIAVALVFAGCNKPEEISEGLSVQSKSSQQNMRIFNDFDELNAEIEKTLSFTLEELTIHENSIGFTSFGRLADIAMEKILEMVEIAESEIINATITEINKISGDLRSAVNNSQYLQLVTMEDGEEVCETRYYKSPYRYLMNADRMFKVEDSYFKVFEGGHVSTHEANFALLQNLSESDFILLEDTETFYTRLEENETDLS